MQYKSWIWTALVALLVAGPSFATDMSDRTHEFRVMGMTCALCVPAIEKGLTHVEGVRSISVDQPAERVRIVARESVSAEALESAIEGAGHFEAELLSAR